MAYCTLDNIKAMMDEEDLISFTDDVGAGVVDTDVTDEAIADADAEIDSYVMTRYSVPLNPVPAIIKKQSVDIAIYNICSRRQRVSDEVRQRYEDVIKFLEKVPAGKVGIAGAASAPASSSNDAVTITSNTKIFSRDKMEGF